jgi:hypothetical protein
LSAQKVRKAMLVTGALAGVMALSAPPASAVDLPLPVACESTAQDVLGGVDPQHPDEVTVRGSGQILCVDATGGLIQKGVNTFHGRIPKASCLDSVSKGYLHSRVDWADGRVTSGTLTDFHETKINGVMVMTISGTNDAASTRYRGWDVSIVDAGLGGCGLPAAPSGATQVGVVTYLP